MGGTYNGRTALMQAACSGATDMVTLLLKNGADPFATDRYGRNVIQQAAVMHRESVVRASAWILLLWRGVVADAHSKQAGAAQTRLYSQILLR